jgi:D-alanine-D-alanine ligase
MSMYKTRIGVLRGGPSSEYEVSLKTGRAVLTALADKYELRDILIDKKGVWHLRGVPVEPSRALEQIDVVFNALHGKYGEDGKVQRFLDSHAVRYTGSGALASSIAMNKALTKNCLKHAPFKHPVHKLLVKEETDDTVILELFRTFPMPCVVKPADGGSSVATALVQSFSDLVYALTDAFSHSDLVLVEQFIKGREATVAVADHFRGERLYGFPPVEITYRNSVFFDYGEKYGENGAIETCPARFEKSVTDALLQAAKHVHATLGLRDYSRSDFIVTPRDIFFLEVNTLPGLTPTSLVPKSVSAVGATLPSFLEHLVQQALVRK